MQISVTVGGLDGTSPVKCSRDVVIVPDVGLASVDKDSFDVIVSCRKSKRNCRLLVMRQIFRRFFLVG